MVSDCVIADSLRVRLRILKQPIEVAANMRGLCRRSGQRYRAIEISSGFLDPSQLQKESTARAEIMKVSGQRFFQRRNH